MSAKKLDQSVFDGLPSEYRWAVTDFCGEVFALSGEKPELNAQKNDWHFCGKDYLLILCKYGDASDWQNSLIERLSDTCIDDMGIANAQKKSERQDAPTSDIDWIEGAAYWCKPFPPIQPSGFFINADFTQVHDGVSWVDALPQVKDLQSGVHSLNIIKRESIHDVARSIEAARVAEQSERNYPHYFKDVSAVDAIDLYHVARLYDITDPALFHAFKKIACAGKRGAKDQAQDVQEAIDALKRWKELNV